MAAPDAFQTSQYLTFNLVDELYALDIVKVREVLDFSSATRVPRTPEFMRGVINLRGSVVPVMDLRLKFGMGATEKTVNTCVIITEVVIDGDAAVLGILADSVQEVIELGPEDIAPPPKIGTKLRIEFIRGIGRRDDRFIIMLDIDRVFSADELAAVQVSAPAPGAGSARS